MKYSRILLILMLFASTIASYFSYVAVVNYEREHVENVSLIYRERLTNAINEVINLSQLLEDVVVFYDGAVPDEMLPVFSHLVYDHASLISINFMPDGVLEFSYPAHSLTNDDERFHSFHHEDKASEKALAISHDKIMIQGPVELSNENYTSDNIALQEPISALVVKNPVYIETKDDKKLWGYLTLLIRPYEAIIEASSLVDLEELGYEYALHSNVDGQFTQLHASNNFDNKKNSVSQVFVTSDEDWQLLLYKREHDYSNLLNVFFIFFAYVSVSFLLFFAFRQFEKVQQKTYENSLLDALTGLKNRKAIDLLAKDEKAYVKNGFTIFYLDLNKFKPINDEYGHDTGDLLLKAFAGRLARAFDANSFVARAGGDEFVVVIFKKLDDKVCEQLKKRIIALAESRFYILQYEFYISTSVGYASSNNEGESFMEVFNKADKAMFEYKMQNR